MTDAVRTPAARTRSHDREDAIADVAALYYQARLDQTEIAERLGVSRSTVSRMLSEALETGIVEIRIRRALPLADGLQKELTRTFGLRDALVLDVTDGADPVPRVGRIGARYLDSTLAEGDVLAISWGTGIRAVVDGFEPHLPRHVEIIQMLGGGGSRDPDVDGTELARRLADVLGGRCRYLNAPLVVDDEEVAAALLRQRGVRETLAAAAQADLALVGIGAFVPAVSSLVRAGHLGRSEVTAVRRSGVVGDVCGHLFTVDGAIVDHPLTRRIVTIGLEGLRSIPRVIAVAVGPAKSEAIVGALRSGLVNVLVTDSTTASDVLAVAARCPAGPGR